MSLELASVIISCLIRRDSLYTCSLEEIYIIYYQLLYTMLNWSRIKKKQYFYLMEFELIFSFFWNPFKTGSSILRNPESFSILNGRPLMVTRSTQASIIVFSLKLTLTYFVSLKWNNCWCAVTLETPTVFLFFLDSFSRNSSYNSSWWLARCFFKFVPWLPYKNKTLIWGIQTFFFTIIIYITYILYIIK